MDLEMLIPENRFLAKTLKSAIGGYLFLEYFKEPVDAVNHARCLLLGLSPVKKLSKDVGTGYWLKKLLEHRVNL